MSTAFVSRLSERLSQASPAAVGRPFEPFIWYRSGFFQCLTDGVIQNLGGPDVLSFELSRLFAYDASKLATPGTYSSNECAYSAGYTAAERYFFRSGPGYDVLGAFRPFASQDWAAYSSARDIFTIGWMHREKDAARGGISNLVADYAHARAESAMPSAMKTAKVPNLDSAWLVFAAGYDAAEKYHFNKEVVLGFCNKPGTTEPVEIPSGISNEVDAALESWKKDMSLHGCEKDITVRNAFFAAWARCQNLIYELRNKIENMRSDYQTARDSANRAKMERAEVVDNLNRHKDELARVNAELEQTKKLVEHQSWKDAKADAANLNKQLIEIRSHMNECCRIVEMLSKHQGPGLVPSELPAAIKDLAATLALKADKADALNAEVTQLSAKLHAVERENAALRKNDETSRAQVSNLSDQVKQLQRTADRCRQYTDIIHAIANYLENRKGDDECIALDKLPETVRDVIGHLERAYEHACKERDEAKSNLSRLEQAYEGLRKTFNDFQDNNAGKALQEKLSVALKNVDALTEANLRYETIMRGRVIKPVFVPSMRDMLFLKICAASIWWDADEERQKKQVEMALMWTDLFMKGYEQHTAGATSSPPKTAPASEEEAKAPAAK